ncbi:MAG: methyl-accepting chemotaxis protein [Deltaproteobacteria bacterium]|nr:methyl-accepting chemotaxis protein [Deltaproteobacteria bacterium]
MRNRSLAQKLGGGFGVVLILFAAIVLFSNLRFQEVRRLNGRALQGNEQMHFMLQKEIDHLKWMKALGDLFLRDEVTTLSVETDDHKCGLGRWLYEGDAEQLASRDPALAHLVEQLKDPHRRLHESAIKIDQAYVSLTEPLDEIMSGRWIDHLQWAKGLSKAVLSGTTFSGTIDPRACTFGTWYYAYQASDARFGELLRAWEQPHEQLHRSAQAINDALAGGDVETARMLYQTQTLPQIAALENAYAGTMAWINETFEQQQKAESIYYDVTLPAVAEVQQVLGDVRKTLQEQTDMVNTNMQTSIVSTIKLVGAVSVCVIIAGILLAALITRSITAPVKRIIAGLHESAAQVTGSSSQVASAGESLAQGASEQASAIEESSASLEEISSMTKQNADNAKQAQTMMDETGRVVEKVNQHMGNLNDAINEITNSSRETGNIIKTIDEIAFQTNLLALNAAVEAARAGEAGRGFAVVAEEVRNLAQRAAEAAKNTSGRIESTIASVERGNEVTRSTREAFAENMDVSDKVSRLIQEIATASDEQSSGIDQISIAVSGMDQVTQQNASNAEESAAAAEEMNAQAIKVSDLVVQLVTLISGRQGASAIAAETLRPEAAAPVKNKCLPT